MRGLVNLLLLLLKSGNGRVGRHKRLSIEISAWEYTKLDVYPRKFCADISINEIPSTEVMH